MALNREHKAIVLEGEQAQAIVSLVARLDESDSNKLAHAFEAWDGPNRGQRRVMQCGRYTVEGEVSPRHRLGVRYSVRFWATLADATDHLLEWAGRTSPPGEVYPCRASRNRGEA